MKKNIKDFVLENKTVLIRCDFNVPMKNGIIIDDNRIRESLDTIRYAMEKNAKIVLFSHLGKIKDEADKLKNSLEPVSVRLSELLGKSVTFINETRGLILENTIKNMNAGDVVLVQNTRFEDYPDKNESKNDESLGKYWASLGDIFINDAFGTIHRSHASNVGISNYLPSGIGFLIEKEIANLEKLNCPQRPYMVLLGGAKISDKIEVISELTLKADKILIGGGMANTFIKACGFEIGKSVYDEDSIDFAKEMLKKYPNKIVLPEDFKVTKEFSDNNDFKFEDKSKISIDGIALDIGPKTIALYKNILKDAKTIFWNGTMGYSEFKNYENGTKEILDYITKLDAFTILGGGDTVAASKVMGYKDKVGYASTGGGATLEYISGKSLPGLDSIEEK